MNDEQFTVQEWIYAGTRTTPRKPGSSFHAWVAPDGDEKWFSKAPRLAVVGGIYSVEASTDYSTIKIGTARFIKEAPDRDAIVLEHRSHQAAIEADKVVKRIKREGLDAIGDLTLKEARALMFKGVGAQPDGVLAMVVQYMTGGRR